jgi:hypothetical protein
MPVTRIGRYVAASPAELERWPTRESGAKEILHIPNEKTDLVADLKRGLSKVRKDRFITCILSTIAIKLST